MENIIKKFKSNLINNKMYIKDESNHEWEATFNWRPKPASEKEIEDLISLTGWHLPDAYLDFLRIHNGAQLFLDPELTQSVDIFSTEEIISYYNSYYLGNNSLRSAYPKEWCMIGEYNGFGDVFFINISNTVSSKPYIICQSNYSFFELPLDFKEWLRLLLDNEGRRFWLNQ